jgi:outer membrane protein assembly factor BamE (lipoprotein component of BamABCDE complex)
MTDDLVDNKKLIGKTKEEVIELLGPEEHTVSNSRWTYYIGFKPGIMAIDPDVLEIEFEDGKVVKCWTHGT